MSWVKFMWKAALSASVVIGLGSVANADSYEGFNYQSGQNLSGLNGGTGWSGAWDEPQPDPTNTVLDTTAGTGLSFGALSVSGGSSVGQGQYNFVGRSSSTATGTAGTTTYLSFLIRKDVAGDGAGFPAEDPDYGGLEIGSTQRVFVGSLGSGKFGADNAGGGGGAAESSISSALGTTAFIVAKIDWAAGNDTLSIFVNPTPGGVLGAADAVKSDTDLGDLGLLGLSNGVNGIWSFDEIRIGSSFAGVAPTGTVIPLPPALLAFAPTALMAGAAFRRFRSKKA